MQAPLVMPQVRAHLPPGVDGWGVSLNGMMGMVVLFGLVITGIYWGLNRVVVPKVQLREKKKKVGVIQRRGWIIQMPFWRC